MLISLRGFIRSNVFFRIVDTIIDPLDNIGNNLSIKKLLVIEYICIENQQI